MSNDFDAPARLHRGVLVGAVVIGLVLLYVALFALLVAEDVFICSRWYRSVPGGQEALRVVFKPLIWLVEQF